MNGKVWHDTLTPPQCRLTFSPEDRGMPWIKNYKIKFITNKHTHGQIIQNKINNMY